MKKLTTMKKLWTIYRNNKEVDCNIEAETAEIAIDKHCDNRSYDKYGQAGAMTEEQISDENQYLNADFRALEQKEEI